MAVVETTRVDETAPITSGSSMHTWSCLRLKFDPLAHPTLSRSVYLPLQRGCHARQRDAAREARAPAVPPEVGAEGLAGGQGSGDRDIERLSMSQSRGPQASCNCQHFGQRRPSSRVFEDVAGVGLQASVVKDGDIWTSSGSGVTWTEGAAVGSNREWWGIPTSSDSTQQTLLRL